MDKSKRNGIILCAVFMLLSLGFIAFYAVSSFQYESMKANMVCTKAVVTDIKSSSGKYGHTQDVEISYNINDTVYQRKLSSDTTLSFAAGAYGNMRTGDTVSIYYSPDDPSVILAQRTQTVGIGIVIFAIFSFLFFAFILILILRGTPKKIRKRKRASTQARP